ncbi:MULTISPECIES: KAP family P-loop NTPase fold protein [Dethiosulfovibrio]|uniref:KAP family NTPase n=2 Tax=Dethiosulfovibrio TaxID=47054 RepID=A0ABS9ER22_9BACT|nr:MULTISPECIES: P-loop NTPase fold protein [Dethiosulfovibrio]MCF4114218.1 KAP family NTPase [Dethiosulfovibrio russensis]MCF4142592.1 KAP family NTPase [Dethiosulfovibrio marinus]MCF4145111.1 KAP family NTPase [Dethiosulfovibrio acidaminovorans]
MGVDETEDLVKIKLDNPIEKAEEDVLERDDMAKLFVERIVELDVSKGAVVGVLGPWGCGKTSFLNLMKQHLKELGIKNIEFNPWMFSDTDQLVGTFFAEISAQLKSRLGLPDIGKFFERYGRPLSHIVGWLPFGPSIGPVEKLLKSVVEIFGVIAKECPDESMTARREKVEEALKKLDRPIVVVLDDIDRLTTREIRDIFKLVRLTASFSNIIYVLAFDRDRVEKALEEDGLPGRDYLEKIVQVNVDLPTMPSRLLEREFSRELSDVLSKIDDQDEVWPDVSVEIIWPLINNIRDVRRYVAAVRFTLCNLNGQVAIADVLALEAVRVFLPHVFAELPKSIDGLSYSCEKSNEELKNQVYSLIRVASEEPLDERRIDQLSGEVLSVPMSVVISMIKRLFPMAVRFIGGAEYDRDFEPQWSQDRRVAHGLFLRLYLERIVGEELMSIMDAESALLRMKAPDAFEDFLRSIPPERLAEVIGRLGDLEERFRPECVETGILGLFNVLPLIPERRRSSADVGPDWTVRGVISKLLRSFSNSEELAKMVGSVLSKLRGLYSRGVLLSIAKDIENMPEEALDKFEKDWRQDVRQTDVESLIKERELLNVLLRVKRMADPSEPPFDVPDLPSVTLSVLKSAKVEELGQHYGSRAVLREVTLCWDKLKELYGNDEVLQERLEALKADNPKDVDDLMTLVDRYLDNSPADKR